MPDAAHEQVLDLRPFGVKARVTTSSSATGGEYVEMDCTADLGAGTIVHYHPEQEETFRVLEGTLDRLVRGGKVRGTRDLRSIIYMSISAAKYRPDVAVKPPQWVVETIAFIGRRLGYALD